MFLRILFLVVFALHPMPILAGPLEDAKIAYDKGDYGNVLRLLKPLAERGDAVAQNNLGALYEKGRGVPHSYTEAVKWYRKSAEQGFAPAQTNLGGMYSVGWGVPKNPIEAVKWYRKAAEQGFASAQYFLGREYDWGSGVAQNDIEAAKWYRKAAEQGNGWAQLSLGVLYKHGRGVTQNFVLAHMWYNLASASEDTNEVIREMGPKARDDIASRMTPAQIEQAQSLAAKWQPKSDYPKVADEDVRKSLPFEFEIVSTGTGFFVSQQGHLLTNHHVIEDCASVRLRSAGLPSGPAALVASDPHNDLALIKSESRPVAVAVFSQRKRPQLGQSAIIFGFPLSGVLSSSGNLTTGTVSALSGLQDDSRLFQISAPVQPGNSGGPVLDDFGTVVGIVVSKLNARAVEQTIADIPQNVNFAIKGALAAGFLDSNGVDYVTDSGSQTISVEEIAKRAMRFTVLVECLK